MLPATSITAPSGRKDSNYPLCTFISAAHNRHRLVEPVIQGRIGNPSKDENQFVETITTATPFSRHTTKAYNIEAKPSETVILLWRIHLPGTSLETLFERICSRPNHYQQKHRTNTGRDLPSSALPRKRKENRINVPVNSCVKASETQDKTTIRKFSSARKYSAQALQQPFTPLFGKW